MAVAGLKLDDGRGAFPLNCFPVRSSFGRTSTDASGAWLIAHHAEQRKRFKAVLCTKPRTYSRIKEERKKSELTGTKLTSEAFDHAEDVDDGEGPEEDKVLDGFFLMKHCCVDDPADLCSVNVAGQELNDVKEEDLMLFDNVAYVNAGENFLPFEAFRGFPALRELEIPLNGLRSLKISHTDFSFLEMLDLSYNNLSQDDLLTLGLLTKVKVLHLTGNNLKNLPLDLAMPYLSREKQVRLQRFASLEVLLLDDNKFMEMTVFAALAGLPKLRHLNMAKNGIYFVPQLKSVEGRVVTQDGKERKRSRRPGSSRKSGRRSKAESNKDAELVDLEAKTDLTGTGTGISLVSQPLIEEPSTEAAEDVSAGGGGADKQEENMEGAVQGEATAEDTMASTTVEGKGVVDADRPDTVGTSSSFQELLNEDFSTGDLSARITELETENALDAETDMDAMLMTSQHPMPKLPPFPELRYLNLATNQICEEEALVAIAAWPMLVELDIHDNPLTNEKSGDPPIIKRFLQDRLGIKINRKKASTPGKGVAKNAKVEIRPKNRKITEQVPKVPKLSLEEKMAIELPPHPPNTNMAAEHHGSSPVPNTDFRGKKRSVLPPIPSTPKDEITQAWANQILEEEDEEYYEDQMDREPSDAFFMTQLDDMPAATSSPQKQPANRGSPTTLPVHAGNHKGRRKHPSQETVPDDRYKGYELLLDIEDIEDEPGLPPPSDIQGNIRALKHTLNHQLVYRDPAVELNKVKKMVPEYRRVPMPPPKPHQSYQERVDDVLDGLKNRSVTQEEKLTTILKDKKKNSQQFPDAEHLLGQIQRRYNAVRVHSMRDVKAAKQVTENALNLLPRPNVRTK